MMPYGFWSGWGWLLIILFFGAMFFLRRCGWGGGCGMPRFPEHHDKGSRIDHSENAIEILNKRYAKGEITEEEYRRMKEEISRR